ncbi:penicillin-binding transpeptidase domain-containing protein [Herbidospora mongoliensis]|uniref:penicillin-binding transpeptidase domain-containing protein n=1 Tax=Herbidospora mongoliensis TaxID=688067 RepID=UPI001FDF758C|nr:penicillin-binding transpeptidase domain-containing protein [Herbidospora mongoliensis]
MRGRTIAIISVAGVVAAAGGGAGAWWVLHTRGTPQETARLYATAWVAGDLAAMKTQLVAPVPATFDTVTASIAKDLKATFKDVTLGDVAPAGEDRYQASYTATLDIADVGPWTYQGTFDLVVFDRQWKVDWKPQALHPGIDGTAKLALKTTWPQRAALTDAQGNRIDGGDVGGSVQQLAGFLDKATAKDIAKLGPAYRKNQAIGRGGLQETFQKRLAGTPTTDIMAGDKPLESIKGEKGEAVQTSLDMTVQNAAANAIRDLDKPASLVAIRPSTGEILAIANNRGDFNRALNGQYAPGSTFKTVTAAGLLAKGVGPGESVTCPENANVGGLKIRNSDNAEYGTISFSDSYAYSCNTTFAPLAQEHLGADGLYKTAGSLGFNQPLNIGVPATKGSMPKATSDAELAAESFGQAKIIASPLVMASVAAAIADGTWRPPTLVPGLKQKAEEIPLADGVADGLRGMMQAVVSKGTAKAAGLPSGSYGKTGTAEYGSGPKLPSHAWFHGYRKDVAFAVVVEGGGGGGKVAAPVAADFLRGF